MTQYITRIPGQLVINGIVVALILFSTLAMTSDTRAQGSPTEDENFGIDLSGVEFSITGPPPTSLSMMNFMMLDIMESWGAEIDRVELANTTGVQALIAGQADFSLSGVDELIFSSAAGANIIAVGSTQDKMDYVLIARDGIDSVDDLAGKSIGMSGPAGYDSLLSRMAVQEAGLSVDDVNFVQIGGSPDRAAAILSGRIDAATVFISDWYELQERTDELSALVFMNELVSTATKSTINTTPQYAEENPDLMFAMACANLESYKWVNSDKEGFIAYTLEHVDGSTEEATAALYDQLIEIEMYPLDVEELLEPDGVQTVADLLYESGEISAEVDGPSLVDRSYLEAAWEAGCGQ